MMTTHTCEPASAEPVLASWKVSEVLGRYPQLLDVLVAASPAFRPLRNPVMRKVQSRLVTVAQAAQIAGLAPAELTRSLNAALGLATPAGDEPAERAEDGQARPLETFEDAPVAVELDVRPYHARGEEPFSAIMAAVARVPAGQALRLRNTFEPLPLYDVLARRGFRHQARRLGPDDWEILFVRASPPTIAPDPEGQPADRPPATRGAGQGLARTGADGSAGLSAPSTSQPAQRAWSEPAAIVEIDVSDLVPPEPMVRILEAAGRLQPEETLLVRHVRRPIYLYPRLDALGYQHETRELGPGQVEIRIRRPGAGTEAPRDSA